MDGLQAVGKNIPGGTVFVYQKNSNAQIHFASNWWISRYSEVDEPVRAEGNRFGGPFWGNRAAWSNDHAARW